MITCHQSGELGCADRAGRTNRITLAHHIIELGRILVEEWDAMPQHHESSMRRRQGVDSSRLCECCFYLLVKTLETFLLLIRNTDHLHLSSVPAVSFNGMLKKSDW